ncbi:MAG TPA: hypothetical protein VHL11_06030, partial [Phototrophicaceae bacterium]|nr:hypothetical protein [Phototrophicaceae bacterium]
DLITITDGLGCKVYDEEGKLAQPFAYRRAVRLQELRDDAERRRLLYVAATRAQDLLIVSGEADTAEWKAKGWLGWLLEVIPLDDETVHIHVPLEQPDPEKLIPTELGGSGMWDRKLVRQGKSIPDTPILVPGMLSDVQPRKRMQARHLAATSIADLGGFLNAEDETEAQVARDRFRRKLLYDAPAVIPRVQFTRDYPVSARQVGEIVHDALRWWSYPFDDTDSQLRHELLQSYAWEHGVTDDQAMESAVRKADELLNKYSQSVLYRRILGAYKAGTPVFRELPFIYERDKHIVHGVIDVLFQLPAHADEGEKWVLADYKTSRLRRAVHPMHPGQWRNAGQSSVFTVDYDTLAQHARRYHLQVGLYAEATQRHLGGIIPQVFIHYVGYGTLVEVPESAWRLALANGLSAPVLRMIEPEQVFHHP